IEGHRWGQGERVALAAALLAERDPFSRGLEPVGERVSHAATPSDVLDRVEALEEFERTGRRDAAWGSLHRGATAFLLRARDQLVRSLRSAVRQTVPERMT